MQKTKIYNFIVVFITTLFCSFITTISANAQDSKLQPTQTIVNPNAYYKLVGNTLELLNCNSSMLVRQEKLKEIFTINSISKNIEIVGNKIILKNFDAKSNYIKIMQQLNIDDYKNFKK